MRNITKRFGPVLANDRCWLDIYKGEILALLGENGSGKTTLMNMMGFTLPNYAVQLIQAVPYIVTILVLIFISAKKRKDSQGPAALGLAYFREER